MTAERGAPAARPAPRYRWGWVALVPFFLFAALCVVVVCFAILRTDDGRKMWLSQKLAWAEAYGSPADVQRALEEFDTAYAAASGNLHLIAFRARWKRSATLERSCSNPR